MVSERDLARPERAALIEALCGFVTIAGPIYWSVAEPVEGEIRFDGANRITHWAQERSIRVHGHTLVWHQMAPAWLSRIDTPSAAAEVLERRVQRTVTSLPDILSWDVVNEPLRLRDGHELGLRRHLWMDLLGSDYLARSIRAARAVAPHVRLGINETRVESESSEHRRRRARLLDLARMLVRQNAAPDFIGIQAHLSVGEVYSQTGIGRFVTDLSTLGIETRISELDCRDDYAGSPNAIDERVTSTVRDFLRACGSAGTIYSICSWGLFDDTSWLQTAYPRVDGAPLRPLPVSADGQIKPMLSAILEAIGDRCPQVEAPRFSRSREGTSA